VLGKLSSVGGAGTEPGTILGDVFHANEKTSSILQNIASLGILETKQDGETVFQPDGMGGKMPAAGISSRCVFSLRKK